MKEKNLIKTLKLMSIVLVLLVFLLTTLINLKDRKRMILLGLVFILFDKSLKRFSI